MPDRTLIVCLPPGADRATALGLAQAHATDARLHPWFLVRHRRVVGLATGWCEYRLVGAIRRYGWIQQAAGGHIGRLDLARGAGTAANTATQRWRYWHEATTGSPKATPWHVFLQRHLDNPRKLTLDAAKARYLDQPRLLAMQAANAIPSTPHRLNVWEVDAYQAGPHAYSTLHRLTAVAGDALITTGGTLLQPESTAFGHTIGYLTKACRHIHHLPRGSALVAVAI